MSGALVISLDFELMWGVRDGHTIESYGAHIRGVRDALPAMLALFAERGIRATWATVGLLFCRDRDELLAACPPEELRPRYRDPRLSTYAYFDQMGQSAADDPYSFAPDLVERIAETPGQEIGTHTFSHFYAQEGA
ncbi:MAG: polysaccharide deacetylase, partial [Pseudomonadota bacterium]